MAIEDLYRLLPFISSTEYRLSVERSREQPVDPILNDQTPIFGEFLAQLRNYFVATIEGSEGTIEYAPEDWDDLIGAVQADLQAVNDVAMSRYSDNADWYATFIQLADDAALLMNTPPFYRFGQIGNRPSVEALRRLFIRWLDAYRLQAQNEHAIALAMEIRRRQLILDANFNREALGDESVAGLTNSYRLVPNIVIFVLTALLAVTLVQVAFHASNAGKGAEIVSLYAVAAGVAGLGAVSAVTLGWQERKKQRDLAKFNRVRDARNGSKKVDTLG